MRNQETVYSEPRVEYDETMRKLTVRGAYEFPREAYELADEIEVLDMSHNQLTRLPDDLGRFTRMRVGFFSGNPLGEVPTVLAECAQLQLVGLKSCRIETMAPGSLPAGIKGIILTDNQLTELPATFGEEYRDLRKLMLTGNQLSALPDSLRAHTQLELLRMAANRFETVPDLIGQLPSLAWYSDAGNPLHHHTYLASAHRYGPEAIVLGKLLGASSKNQVYRAMLDDQEVAVKLFGTGVTTDGLPADEVQASVRAGTHEALIGTLGVYQHDEQIGLVMPLVPSSYHTVAQPPDFTTLTRDVYPLDCAMSTAQSLTAVRDVAKGLRHLHAQGVMHGDVYAHNILTDDSGRAVLGDFGASSLYDPADSTQAWREQLDVLGFGRLVAELAAHVTGDAARLREVAASCVQTNAAQRPSFAQLERELA